METVGRWLLKISFCIQQTSFHKHISKQRSGQMYIIQVQEFALPLFLVYLFNLMHYECNVHSTVHIILTLTSHTKYFNNEPVAASAISKLSHRTSNNITYHISTELGKSCFRILKFEDIPNGVCKASYLPYSSFLSIFLDRIKKMILAIS